MQKSLCCHAAGKYLCVSFTLDFSPLQISISVTFVDMAFSSIVDFLVLKERNVTHNLCRNLIVVLQNGTTEEVTSEEEEEEDMGEVCVYTNEIVILIE